MPKLVSPANSIQFIENKAKKLAFFLFTFVTISWYLNNYLNSYTYI
jgi:hypothetical protein